MSWRWIKISAASFISIQFNSVFRFKAIQFSFGAFTLIEFSLVQFNPIQFFCSAQLESAQFNLIHPSWIQFSFYIQFSSTQFKSTEIMSTSAKLPSLLCCTVRSISLWTGFTVNTYHHIVRVQIFIRPEEKSTRQMQQCNYTSSVFMKAFFTFLRGCLITAGITVSLALVLISFISLNIVFYMTRRNNVTLHIHKAILSTNTLCLLEAHTLNIDVTSVFS